MKSNNFYTKFLKFVFLYVAIFLALSSLDFFFTTDSITANGQPTSFDIYDLAISLLSSVLFFCFWLLLKDKIVRVKLGGQNLTILGDTEEAINWHDIESLKQLILVHPPLYKLRIKNRAGYYLFVTSPFAISFGFGTIDLSEMGTYLKQKRKELGL